MRSCGAVWRTSALHKPELVQEDADDQARLIRAPRLTGSRINAHGKALGLGDIAAAMPGPKPAIHRIGERRTAAGGGRVVRAGRFGWTRRGGADGY